MSVSSDLYPMDRLGCVTELFLQVNEAIYHCNFSVDTQHCFLTALPAFLSVIFRNSMIIILFSQNSKSQRLNYNLPIFFAALIIQIPVAK